jgi:hypothetical protein
MLFTMINLCRGICGTHKMDCPLVTDPDYVLGDQNPYHLKQFIVG